VGTVKHWVHTLATNLLTLIAVHPKRGIEAMEDIGVLAQFTGTIVHDGFASYDLFADATHARCGVHVIRHLKDVGKTASFESWTNELIAILLEAKLASETAAAAGRAKVKAKAAADIRRRYHQALDQAFLTLPEGPPPRRRHVGGWSIYQRQAWNLATRMRDRADEILRTLDDTRVPLDNNVSERALRMVKLHDKVSGTFASLTGAEAFAAIRSYLQTAAKHGQNLLAVLHQLFTDGP